MKQGMEPMKHQRSPRKGLLGSRKWEKQQTLKQQSRREQKRRERGEREW